MERKTIQHGLHVSGKMRDNKDIFLWRNRRKTKLKQQSVFRILMVFVMT